jgi:hypothetical protein
MPGHVNPSSKFTVSFMRGGEVVDARSAPTGERALKAAIVMLAEQEALENGDRLTVSEG